MQIVGQVGLGAHSRLQHGEPKSWACAACCVLAARARGVVRTSSRGVNEKHPVANLSNCVIYGTQGPFENPVSSLFFLWVCSLEEFQNKDALNTI